MTPGKHNPKLEAINILKYIGPGFLVAVGFMDPGNWASNLSAGSSYGYSLLWMVTLSTFMLIILQHNAAHLGIATGLCLSEATTAYVKKPISTIILASVMAASVSTSFAEILGAGIALNLLFGIPPQAGAILVTAFIVIMLFTNTYRFIEKGIIALVSIIGLSFIYELSLVHVDWGKAASGWITPGFPKGSMPVVMSVLGAVVMPHNLFLHSEIIQTRKWNLENEGVIRKQLRYEFLDTLLSMLAGWAINSAMILLAATAFFANNETVDDLSRAERLLEPLLGNNSGFVFSAALLLSGISSATTSGMAAGSIFAGLFREPYDMKDSHTRAGALISLVLGAGIVFFVRDPLKGLVVSQMILSIQLPVTIFTQIYLTSSEKVMGTYKNSVPLNALLAAVGVAVAGLNVGLFFSLL